MHGEANSRSALNHPLTGVFRVILRDVEQNASSRWLQRREIVRTCMSRATAGEKVVRRCKGVCAPLSWPRVWCRDDRGPLGAALKPSHYNQVECDLVNNIKPRCPDGVCTQCCPREPRGANTRWLSCHRVYCATIKSWILNEVSLTERYVYYM